MKRSVRYLGARLVVVAFVLVAVLSMPRNARAQDSANMQVSANVIRKCTITAQPLAFGSYDPVQANYTAPLDAQANLSVACTKGTAVNVAMDSGTNAAGAVRRMTSGGAEYLVYEVYKDSSRAEVWGSSGAGLLNAGIAPSRDPRQFTVYGRVPGGQDAAEGAFQDTLLVTVQF